MTNQPLVSVVTPSFNQGQWLIDNLNSVAVQTYPNVEHIIFDGESADGSLEVLRTHAGPKVRWRSEPDGGQSDAINKAFRDARGEIIGWLNSDDAYFGADAIALAVDAFERHPEADLVYGHAALVNASGLMLQVLHTPPAADRLMRLHNFLVQPAVFVRRRALGDTMVDPTYDFTMDWELWLRLERKGRFARVNRILAIDRHQPGRKVITRKGPIEEDVGRLRMTYRLLPGSIASIVRKPLKLTFRWLGAARLAEAVRTPFAFAGRVDNATSLLTRQLAVPRSRMPFE